MKTALISVSDKTGVLDLGRAAVAAGFQILSTGGTARAFREAGLSVREVSDYTGFSEMMDGRVKTLHPKIHGGLLHLRDHPEHVRQAKEHGIAPIDLVVVNLYPFEATVARPGCAREEAIEQIDIGGPAMLRSAAKNARSVTVIVDPADYPVVIAELKAKGDTTRETRRRLAQKVFATTARYDSAIAAYLAEAEGGAALPEVYAPQLRKIQALRYGENPHQQAALYGDFFRHFEQLHGKELSYNNLLDLAAAAELIGEFDEPAVAILKHNNPCGVGQAAALAEAWDLAFATDRQAPFGGVIAVNRPLDLGLAEKIAEIFSEVIIAPAFAPDARALLEKKKTLRLMIQKTAKLPPAGSLEARSCPGGLLVQQADAVPQPETEWKIVTKRAPTADEMRALRFGWRVVKRVKSNAIVFARSDRTLGVGAGQMSRVDAARLAVWKAREAGLSLDGCAVASDAFFPFPDGLLAAADAGAKAAIQPGGSVKDAEVIAAADARDLAMVFTGRRHFRH
ncbi:MAG: bifunctional phosphoribosylaminoimidazolecarboxamide formyltransferase/IMP cyclohydrolase [Verrucomicrobiae bacterium]|nr:bifunctional phosphoribosylaminoimidazolecarboxamide formyltransferase/IMP cyclohydrolase [Verrucomicrobiae bacterium]